MNIKKLKNIEELEYKYLMKYFYFLKFAEDEMLDGFATKEKIKEDWSGYYGGDTKNVSEFAVGAERIVYALLNGKGIGQPNSCPVSSDLFFEVNDAFIHIDLKTVQTNNIGDYTTDIFVGKNQNSYRGKMLVHKGRSTEEIREYNPHLPTRYNKGKENEKICLSYFITILSNSETLDVEVISIMCMPNGELEEYYKDRPLKPGKNPDKTRFHFTKTPEFELLEGHKKRVKVIYYNKNMDESYKNRLKKYFELFINNDNGL